MWKYIKKYKWQNLAVAGMNLIVCVAGVTGTIMYILITRAILDNDMKQLFLWVGVAFLLNIMNCLVFGKLLELMKKRTISLMNQEMRANLNQKLMRRSYEEFRKTDSGEYLSEYTNVIREAEEKGFLNFYNAIEISIDLILGVVILAYINIWLLILTIVVSVVITLLTRTMRQMIRDSSNLVAEEQTAFTEQVTEQVGGFRVLKYFGLSRQLGEAIDEAQTKLEEKRLFFQKKQSGTLQFMNLIIHILNLTLQVALFGMALFRMIPVEIIAGGIGFVGMVQGGIGGLSQISVQFAGAEPYFAKLNPEHPESKEGVPLPEVRREIRVKNLTYAYGDTPVFSNKNLEFQIGKKYAVVGKSGCGKTTLLRIILGQLTGYEGELLFDGKDAKNYREDSFYDQMAYIDQNVFLMNTTIRENITLGDTFTEEELEDALLRSALKKELVRFANGLDTLVGENGKLLSGGQKQRVAIARALIHKRKILVVDEGTSALDRENAEVIEKSLLQQKELTLILVSHHLSPQREREYTKIWRMDDGAGRREVCGNT